MKDQVAPSFNFEEFLISEFFKISTPNNPDQKLKNLSLRIMNLIAGIIYACYVILAY